jgi:hypothetical protein
MMRDLADAPFVTTVYVDLDQVGFLRPSPSDAWPQAANLG